MQGVPVGLGDNPKSKSILILNKAGKPMSSLPEKGCLIWLIDSGEACFQCQPYFFDSC